MLDWLKRKLAGGRVGLRNPAGVSAEALGALAAYLAPLDSVSRGLAGVALAYVVDGEGGPPTGVRGAARAMSLACVTPFGNLGKGPGFMARQQADDPSVNLRLARALHAAAVADGWQSRFAGLPGGLQWLEVFLREVVGMGPNMIVSSSAPVPWDAAVLAGMLREDGQDPEWLVRLVCGTEDLAATALAQPVAASRGFGTLLAAHPRPVLDALSGGPAPQKVHVLALLGRLRPDLAPFRDALVALAVSSARTVREPASALLPGQPVQADLERRAREGKGEERVHAVRLLARLFPADSRAALESLRAGATGKLAAALVEVLAEAPREEAAPPAPAAPPPAGPLSPATRALLRQAIEKSRELNDQVRAHGVKVKAPPGDPLSFVETGQGEGYGGTLHGATPLADLLACPDLGLLHFVRLAFLLGFPANRNGDWVLSWLFWHQVEQYRRRHPDFGLRDLEAALGTLTGRADLLGRDLVLSTWSPELDWPAEHLAPYYEERLHLLEEALEVVPPAPTMWIDKPGRRLRALKVLQRMDRVPPSVQSRLWDLALTGGKAEAPRAREVLSRLPDFLQRVLQELTNGRKEVRAGAADWLGRLGDDEAVQPLLAAVRKEKQEVPRVAMMGALERLGVPLDAFLDRAGLEKEAAAGLKSGLPQALAWFPWDRLPEVRWADGGSPVGEAVLRWTLVKCHKLKSPEPGPLLRRYAALWERAGREALAGLVLDAWIGRDTKPRHTHAEAVALAERDLPAFLQWSPDRSPESLRGALIQGYLDMTEGSATADKGLLAVVGACGGPAQVAAIEAYLKKWYGRRAAQCKALLGALSGLDHPLAVQLLLSVANRFRTRGIQQEALRLGQVLAERHGWTVEELGDRTLPAAGLDERGELALDYGTRGEGPPAGSRAPLVGAHGARRFTVRLTPDMKLAVFDEDGKELSGLPAARQSDDPERVKEAARILKEARAELKTLLKQQPQRLYDAMCLGRTWAFADWDRYLHRHAVLRSMVARLVWVTEDGVSFRPLEDGSLTDAADEPVEPDPGTRVRIAHRLDLGDDGAAAWTRHLAEYGVEPLFDPLGRPAYRLPEGLGDEVEVADFRGHLVSSQRLRSRATALGYVRGAAEDGGWFYTYRRTLAGPGLEAVLTFSGNSLPEENRTVALDHLSFAVPAPGGGVARTLRLKEVPPVLLSEAWNDLRQVAAEGPGFDPEWQGKVSRY